jgi:hypothetical protein
MRFLSLSFLFLLPLLSFAQDKFAYKVSTPYRVIDSPEKFYFSSEKDNSVLSIKRVGNDLYMQRFDANSMKEVARERHSDLPKGFILESID